MTGEGIYYAVATGIAAGRTAAGGGPRDGRPTLRARRTGAAVRRLLGRHLKHTWIASRLARVARPIVDAGIRAAARDRSTFDDLVELGLGDGRITGSARRRPGDVPLTPDRGATHDRSSRSAGRCPRTAIRRPRSPTPSST